MEDTLSTALTNVLGARRALYIQLYSSSNDKEERIIIKNKQSRQRLVQQYEKCFVTQKRHLFLSKHYHTYLRVLLQKYKTWTTKTNSPVYSAPLCSAACADNFTRSFKQDSSVCPTYSSFRRIRTYSNVFCCSTRSIRRRQTSVICRQYIRVES